MVSGVMLLPGVGEFIIFALVVVAIALFVLWIPRLIDERKQREETIITVLGEIRQTLGEISARLRGGSEKDR